MTDGFDPGALLARSYALPDGRRVRLRLAHRRDAPAVRGLLARRGTPVDDLELARILRADPRVTVAITAAALVDGVETVIGFGAIEAGAPEPVLLCVCEHPPAGLPELLCAALAARSGAIRARQRLTRASG